MHPKNNHPAWQRYGFGHFVKEWVPKALPVQLQQIPLSLRLASQWVAWDWVQHGESWRKVPISPKSSLYCTTPDTSYSTDIVQASQFQQTHGLPGIGLVLTKHDQFIAIDIDRCVDLRTGSIDAEVQNWVKELNSYTEYSPSGTGIHVIAIQSGNSMTGIETYGRAEVFASDGFVTITGQVAPGTPPIIQATQLSELRHLLRGDTNDPNRRSGWFHQLPNNPIRIHSTMNGFTLFSSEYSLYLRDRDLGEQVRWSIPLGKFNNIEATLTRHNVIFADNVSHLYALDRLSGKMRWTNDRIGRRVQIHTMQDGPLLIDSDYGGNSHYSGTHEENRGWKLINEVDGSLVKTERGQVAWVSKHQPGRFHGAPSKPHTGFITVSDRLVEGHDRITGELAWTQELEPLNGSDQVEWVDGMLVLSRFEESEATIIDVVNGTKYTLGEEVDSVFPFSLSGNNLITTGLDELKCISIIDGSVRWRRPDISVDRILEAISHHIICEGTSPYGDDMVFVFDAVDGRLIREAAGTYLGASNQRLWVLASDNNVHAFGIDGSTPHQVLVLPSDVQLVPHSDDGEYAITGNVEVLDVEDYCLLSNGMVLLEYAL